MSRCFNLGNDPCFLDKKLNYVLKVVVSIQSTEKGWNSVLNCIKVFFLE